MSFLEVKALDVRHGLLRAVREVSFQVNKAEIVAFVGANGAGKTTLFRAIAGAHKPASGRVLFDGADVTAMPDYARVKKGIVLVPEGRRLFTDMSVYENLVLAKAAGRQGQWDIDSAVKVFPNLAPRLKQKSDTLSGGEQQATAIARALMTNPDILLLDEVSLGLSPAAVDRVYESIQRLIEVGTTILLVEQDLNRALSVADRVICMLEGKIAAQGPVGEMTRERIMDAYFGLRQAQATGASV
jgi:branched-chain amino acid transport system ATP-binding protein